MTSNSSGRGPGVALPDVEGIRVLDSTQSKTGDQYLIRERYLNADGRVLTLYRHAEAIDARGEGHAR